MKHLWKTGLEILKNHRKQSLFLLTGIILIGASIVFSVVYAEDKKVEPNPTPIAAAETIQETLETPVETIVETAVDTAVETAVEAEILAETAVESPVETKTESESKKTLVKDVPVPKVAVAPVNNAEDPEPARQSSEEVDVSDLVKDEPVVEKPKAPAVKPPAPAPVETPVVTVPVEPPVVTAPVETPVSTTPVETPVIVETPAVETPVVIPPVETPVIVEPSPVETPVETTPPAPIVAPVIYGVDVSKWDGKIDWKQVKESGIHFAMVRVGYRTLESGTLYEDPFAKYNLQEAHANGVKVGAYFFSTAISEEEVLEEAVWVSNFLKPYTISYPVAYDCEGFRTSRQSLMTIEERTNLAITFLDVIKSNGYTPLFYGSKYDLNNQWNTLLLSSKYKIWAAQYPSTPYPETPKSSYSGKHAMWQFTSNGTVPGISPGVDINIDYLGF